MIKNLLFVCCFVAGLLFASAQERKDLPTGACNTDALHLKLLKEDADYKEKFNKNNALWQEWAPKHSKAPTKPRNSSARMYVDTWTPVILQVVFHDMRKVMPVPAQSNLIDYQKLVDKLNIIYSGSIPGSYNPPQENTQIQFCLAKQDVFGNVYTTTQHHTNLTIVDPTEIDQIKTIATDSESLLTFPRTKYINIYLVDAILAHPAFAFLPPAHGKEYDGIYIIRESLATTNTDNDLVLNKNMTSLAHEMGHYLGLFHTFGICDPDVLALPTLDAATTFACSCANSDPFSNGDKVQDTPPMELHNQSCLSDVYSCGNGNLAVPIPDFKHYYMDYVSYECRYYFSHGQIDRMQFMLDTVYGARKSLLGGTSACANCDAMTGYQPVITPTTNTIFQLNQLASTNFTANFLNGTSAFTPIASYTWTLQFLDSVATPTTSTNTTFLLNSSLTVGNYNLTLKADIGNGCFKTTTFLFSIVPDASISDACITLPVPASTTDWGAWNRVYYKGGWSRATGAANSGFSYPTTIRDPFPANNDPGFEILNLADLATNDPNFNNITSPPPPSVTRIMRVGRKITGLPNLEDGAAYYVNYTFHPTPANCKYRIWYLGMSNITAGYSLPTNIVYQYINTNQSGETSFGVLSRCQFNSPVIQGGAPTALGMNENGYLIDNPSGSGFINRTAKLYGLNDMVFNRIHSTLTGSDYDYVSLGSTNYVRTKVWKFYDLDFSEFVDTPGQGSNINTQVTLTFFARTNDAAAAKSHSYAYYGIECRGGGMPADITMDLPNIQLSCQAPATRNCAYTINLPRPKYALEKTVDNGNSYLTWINPSLTDSSTYTNLATLTVASSVASPLTGAPSVFSPIAGSFNTYVNTIQSDNQYANYQLKLCNIEEPNASIFYKVTLKTLHKTLESVFRVTNGYKTFSPPCAERLGTILGPAIRYVCSNDSQFDLEYNTTLPCSNELVIPGTPKYKWKKKTCTDATCTAYTEDIEITNEVGAKLTVIPANLSGCATLFTRYTEYNDPFCGKNYFPEPTFTVYNTTSFNSGSYTPNIYDICINGMVKVDIKNFKLSLPNCTLPTAISPVGSYVKFDLVAGSNNAAPSYLSTVATPLASSPNTIYYNALTNVAQPDFSLFFSNTISTSTGTGYLFPTNGTKTIYIKITYHILGCTKIVYAPVIFHIVNSSEPGAIKVSGVTCSSFSILNADATTTLPNPTGVTNPAGTYGWEYATTGLFNPLPAIPGNPAATTGMTLTNYPFNLLTGSVPFYIRRVSYGLDSCANPNSYTAAIEVTNIPNFTAIQNYCTGTLVSATGLLNAAPNGVTGSWSPTLPVSLNATTTTTTTYTFTVGGTGCTTPITQQVAVTINFIPPPSVPLTGNNTAIQTVCNGDTISSLQASTNLTGANTGIIWYKNPGGLTSYLDFYSDGIIYPSRIYQVSGNYVIHVSQSQTFQLTPTTTLTCISTRIPVPLNIITTTPPAASAQSHCYGETVAEMVVTTGTGIKWYTALTGGTALASNTALTTGTTTYYTSQTVSGCESTRTAVTVTVNPVITPIFTQVAPVCAGVLPQLPNSSNSITGSWAQDVNLSTPTALVYNFTPTVGLCASTATMTIAVNQNVTPTFTEVSPICSGATLAALSTTSNNTITGTWSPALNNTATTTYTFTPATGQCATTATMTIAVKTPAAPTASAQTFCAGSTVSYLVATGTAIKWYSAATAGSDLASTTPLTSGNYYASQTVDGCESTRTAVTVTLTVNNISAQNDNLNNSPFVSSVNIVNSVYITPSVLTNDTYISGTPITLTLGTVPPIIGGLVYNGDGTFTIPVGSNYYGIFSFNYTISQNGCTSNTATASFMINTGTSWLVNCIAVQETGMFSGANRKIILGGPFQQYNYVNRTHFARINDPLTIDTAFEKHFSLNGVDAYVQKVKVDSNNNIFVMGNFNQYNGESIPYGICKLLPTGEIDNAFNNNAGTGFLNSTIADMDILPDDSIIIGGVNSISYNDTPCTKLIHISNNGVLDTTTNYFNANFQQDCNVDVFKTLALHDGTILIYYIRHIQNAPYQMCLKKVNPNGSTVTFNPNLVDIGNSFTNCNCGGLAVTNMKEDASGNIYIVGGFDSFAGEPHSKIVKLSNDGSIYNANNGFNSPTFDKAIYDLEINSVPNSPNLTKIIVAGIFTTSTETSNNNITTTTPRPLIMSLNADGTSSTDNFGTGPAAPINNYPAEIYRLKQQSDGKILVGGQFTSFSGVYANNITRLSANFSSQSKNSTATTHYVAESANSGEAIMELETNVTVFPNPSEGVFNIDLSKTEMVYANVTVYNLLGKTVYTAPLEPHAANQIDLTGLPVGFYVATISGDAANLSFKLIKK